MFDQVFQYILSLWKKPRVVTTDDLDRWEVSYEEQLTMFDCEKVLVEDGHVVGTTAIITDEHKIEETPGPLPSGVQASFDEDKVQLHNAIDCMALMIIDHTAADGRVTTHHGTAFFISEKLLLTAGHNIFASPNVKVKLRITIPGTPYFQESGVGSRNSGPTIDCKLVGTLYKNQNVPWHHDIAILDAGTYNASSYVRLSSELTSLPAKVNVIGFPGNVSWGWLRCHEGLADVPVNRRATDDMFPANRMTITSGQVESLGQTISYKLSTTPGMSGGCVLYNGYAIGVHIGQHCEMSNGQKVFRQDSFPVAVSFTSPKVLNFLRNYTQSHQELSYLRS